MKKTLYIFSVLLLAVVGCTKEQNRSENPEITGFPENATVTVDFSVPSPVETRANGMSNNPEIENLKVAVFNSAGLLKEYKDAKWVEAFADENGTWFKYKVELLLSSTERRIHFIANAPETIDNGNENVVIRSLVTENGAAAYWQRVVLTEGVTPYAYPGGVVEFKWSDDQGEHSKTYGTTGGTSYTDAKGNTVNVGDFVQENGDKVVDGTGYFASVETSSKLEKVPLIRNFARITIVDDQSDENVTFHPIRFRVVNAPDKGFVAPYDAKAGAYVKPYTDAYAKVAEDYSFEFETIRDWGYQAEIPADASIAKLTQADIEDMSKMKDVVVDTDGASFDKYSYDFMYERPLPDADHAPTCVLVEGTLTDTQEHIDAGKRWFKIEITDLDGKYVPIYRDITYVMKIKSITIVGTPGWGTAWEAYNNKSVGDVSTSTETATLNQIADGKGTTLWVEYIDYTSVETTATTVPILYKLFYSTDNENLTDQVELTVNHTDGVAHAITGTVTGSPYTGSDPTPDGQGGWYVAQVPLAAQGTSFMKSTLHIEGPTGASGGAKVLFRNVDYRVIPTQDLTLAVDPTSVPDGLSQEVKLSITLPKDLGYSVFPLVLKIEPKDGNLNPVPAKNKIDGVEFGLPVEHGKSMFSDKKDNSFCFLFTVNFSDYDQATGSTYDLYFSTIRGGANHTTIAVQDRKPYFNLATIDI